MIHSLAVLALSAVTPAHAQAIGATSPAPPIKVVAFRGREGKSCDETRSRDGECVDYVDLFDADSAWNDRRAFIPGAYRRAVWRAIGPLTGHLYEDLTYRWGQGDIEQTVKQMGYFALPQLAESWGRSQLRRRVYSLPARDLVLGVGGAADDWFHPTNSSWDERTDSLFPLVRYVGPEGAEAPPPTVVLSGRFAVRLGFDQKAHDYDIMDADPASSGPFYEQFFPYNSAVQALRGSKGGGAYSAPEALPLQDFRFVSRPLVLVDDDGEVSMDTSGVKYGLRINVPSSDEDALPSAPAYYNAIAEEASRAFIGLRRVVFVQAAQFALEDYTRNQIRVLAAMTAMSTPPPAVAKTTGLARDLVAAARGETDTADEVNAVRGGGLGKGGLRQTVKYQELPQRVLEDWVDRLLAEGWKLDFVALNASIGHELNLNEQGLALQGIDPVSRSRFLSKRLLSAEDPLQANLVIMRAALIQLLDSVKNQQPRYRERVDTWLLLDHTRNAIAAGFDESTLVTPDVVEAGATQAWTDTLALHGYAPQGLPQGLGAVDPLAICTTKDGVEALEEPVFKRVDLDLLVEAPKNLSASQVLWEARGDVPFIAVDDPALNDPIVDRLVDLGNDKTLYRVRYILWSGWHMFWWPRDLGNGDVEVVLRTGAICEDTVLVNRKLAPTVIRAGLLSGNFRPAVPETRKQVTRGKRDERRRKRAEAEPADNEAMIAAAEERAAQAEAAKSQAVAMEEAIRNPNLESISQAKLTLPGEKAYEIVQEDLDWSTRYLRRLAHTPLLEMAGNEAVLVNVFDATAPREWRPIADATPKTPYTRTAVRLRRWDQRDLEKKTKQRQVQVASWTWYFDNVRRRPVLISPAYEPTESVAAKSAGPTWKRRQTTDFWLQGGLGAFPYRHASLICNEAANPESDTNCTGVPHGDGADPNLQLERYNVTSEGAALDLAAMASWWFKDRPRLGLDVGAEVRLDAVHRGDQPVADWIANNTSVQNRLDVALPAAYSIAGGLVLGLRHAIRPVPMFRGSNRRSTWGAPRPDGSSLTYRTQWGVRTGMLMGNGTGSPTMKLLGEGWFAWSARRSRSARATFTPYQPNAYYGPFARVNYGFPLAPDREVVETTLLRSWTFVVGFRAQLRLPGKVTLPGGK